MPARNKRPVVKFSPRYAKGQMAVILTLVIATLIGAMALGADVAVMYFNHLQLQKGVDAAALAGANFLEGSYTYTPTNANCGGQSDYAKEAACDYAANDGLISANNTTLTFNEPGTGLPAGAPTPNIQVIASRSNLPYLFGRVLGLNSYTVAAVATAKASGPTTSVNGLFPMGVQCTSPCSLSTLNPGTPVQFNVKFTPAPTYASGNWQWLQNSGCGNSGASCVSQAITNGMTGTFSVGDPITLDPGNKGSAGPDRQAFNSRFSTTNCPALSGSNDPCNGASVNSIPQNDPCLIVVPAVDFSGSNGASSPPTIEAFADVYIEPGSTISNGNGGSNITACFVQAVTANTISSGGNPINLGSYAQPQLIE
jgi:hypothetical protein